MCIMLFGTMLADSRLAGKTLTVPAAQFFDIFMTPHDDNILIDFIYEFLIFYISQMCSEDISIQFLQNIWQKGRHTTLSRIN